MFLLIRSHHHFEYRPQEKAMEVHSFLGGRERGERERGEKERGEREGRGGLNRGTKVKGQRPTMIALVTGVSSYLSFSYIHNICR